VVEDRVLGVQPLAVHDEAVAQARPKVGGETAGPLLESIEVLLAPASYQEMSATLKVEFARWIEAHPAVGTVHLLLDNHVSAKQLRPRCGVVVLVARLETRALEVVRPRVLVNLHPMPFSAQVS